MKNNFFSFALLAASALPLQANAATTIDLQDFSGTLINNVWQDQTFTVPGVGTFNQVSNTDAPYSVARNDGNGNVYLSPIVKYSDSAHIHVAGGGGVGTNATPFIHGDVGGVFVGSTTAFSFDSMDIVGGNFHSIELGNPNDTITVRGYLGGTNPMLIGGPAFGTAPGTSMAYTGGALMGTATITMSDIGSTFNFGTEFDSVDYVEFFFSDFYGTTPSAQGDTTLDFEFDNIVINNVSAVPVPAAVWLFGTGVMGLVSFGRRKHLL